MLVQDIDHRRHYVLGCPC